MILSLLRKYLLPFSTQHLDVVEPLKIKTPKQLQAQLINIFLSKRKENDEQIRLNKIIIYAIIILFVLFNNSLLCLTIFKSYSISSTICFCLLIEQIGKFKDLILSKPSFGTPAE